MDGFAPIIVEDPETAHWDDASDVVIVGLGAAGVAAALEARALGGEVVALDRFEGGGATAVSGGVFYGGGGSHIQREAGVEDSPENMFRYLSQEVQDAVSEETLRDFCETSADTVRWLAEHGVRFRGSLCPTKTSYPSNDYHLYYSGNETVAPYSDHAKPAARGHRTVGGSLPGAELFGPLRDAAVAAGVRLKLQSRVSRLVVDGVGRVVGAEYEEIDSPAWRAIHRRLHRLDLGMDKLLGSLARRLRALVDAIERRHSGRRRIRARRGVIVSAGGFIFNREMVAEHVPGFLAGLPLGTAGDDGAGIRLGQAVGGAVDRMGRASAWRFLNPPQAFAQGILVDAQGERFANEFWYGAKIGEAMVEERGGRATLIIDEVLRKRARQQVKPGQVQWFQRLSALMNLILNCRRADDLAALALMLGVPRENLERSFAAYNAAAEGRQADPFLKDPALMHPLREGPFYAIDCSLGSARNPCAVMTLGGLVADETTGEVRRPDGSGIPGLYAAGRSAVGICSRQYVSGLSIADCVYSGRRAGRHAAGAGADC
jgi:3-oxo-5alpha-steroid 4-dehydrogenase